MKKIYMLGLISCIVFGWVATASADKTLYVSGKIGANSQSDTNLGAADISPDPGISLIAALGVEFEQPFRLEGELGCFTIPTTPTTVLPGPCLMETMIW